MVRKPTLAGQRGRRSFRHASGFAAGTIRTAGETRGFAISKLLTRWDEIAGERLAEHTYPAKVSYGRDGLGATLTLLTEGAHAPMVEMQAEALRDKVNACYGYRAISRIRVTQTAPTGFAEGQATFTHRSRAATHSEPTAEMKEQAAQEAAAVSDPGLRHALETLGLNVLSRSEAKDRENP